MKKRSSHDGDSARSDVVDTDLTSTVGAFASRIQRKKKEQEQELGRAESAAKVRHDLLLKTLSNVRKSLAKLTTLDLGDRFEFGLEADDWHGWPRLTLKLMDKALPAADYPFLQVLAHDRQSRATVEITCGEKRKPDKLSLIEETERIRLPALLKRCVREYLDLAEKIILDLEKIAEQDDIDLSKRDPGEFEETNREEDAPDEITGDLFADKNEEEPVIDSLPTLDQVEELTTEKIDG